MDRPRLLVIDDDPYTRIALNTLFTRQGWQVSLAATVAQGLAFLDLAPHCLILDLDLPDGGGEAVLREVRTKHHRTRVAVCSGLDDPTRLDRVWKLEPDLGVP
jgi:DNA-binding response OmpR family regulator